jgi:NADPH:quinone reductase-like Zn-dependent oxidoreductase
LRAIAITDFGAPPAPQDLPRPEPAEGEILVRVAASSLNGFDGAVAAGYLKGMMEHRFPVVLGKDFAGTVEAVGPGAARFAVGDQVFGIVMKPVLGDGAFAEYVAVGEAFGVARVPAGLDLATAGALGLAGTAALLAVEAVAPAAGDAVLISGATGGVGVLAVQLAAAAGARVIATARPGAQADLVRGLGAADVVDFTADVASQMGALAPKGVRAVLHFAGDAAALADLVAPGGRFASTLGIGPEQLGGRDLTATALMASPTADVLDRLAAEVAAGRLRVPIHATYRLDDVPRALADFATPHAGKLAVAVA